MQLVLVNLETGEVLDELDSDTKLIDGLGHSLEQRDFKYLLQEIEEEERNKFSKLLVHFERLMPEENLTFIDSYLCVKLFTLFKLNNPHKTNIQFQSVCEELRIEKK